MITVIVVAIVGILILAGLIVHNSLPIASNLEWREHGIAKSYDCPTKKAYYGKQAVKMLGDYGVSVLNGRAFYCDGSGNSFEIAVLSKGGSITYSTHLTSDVIGYADKNELTKILRAVYELTDRLPDTGN